jgi:uncharacterized protein YdeI (YjbR/CyaY-like superfamily)
LPAELEIIEFGTAAAFRAWLEEHHATAPGVWSKVAKKQTGLPAISWDDSVDIALCFGWIDSQRRGLDDRYYLQKYTPRGRRSTWSKINRARVERLIAAGLMTPAGLAEVERAKADGRWDAAYDSPKTMTVPADLQAALDANPEAAAFFATLKSTNRYAILHRVATAVKPETRARRIEKYVAMCERGETVH